jgi:GTP-binding protein
MRAIRAIEDCDVCLFMIDANEGVQKQDLSVFSVIEKNKKGLVLLINKWDSIEKDTSTQKEYKENILSKK